MHSADHAVARCLSVCPSVTRRYSIETAKHIITLFSLSDSYTILVFFIPNGMAVLQWGPPNEGVECRGYEKSRLSTNISLYLGNYARQSHSYYGMQIGNRTQAFEWYHFQ